MFTNFEQLPQDPIFKVVKEFNADKNPKKINLSIGVYTDAEGQPFVFESVKEAALNVDTNNFNYLPIGGNQEFISNTARLFFGDEVDLKDFATQHTCGGTHACSLFSDLVEADRGPTEVVFGTPTWDNYFQIFTNHKIITIDHLSERREVNYESYEKALEKAKKGAVLVLHGGKTHNPTGRNLSIEEVGKLLSIIREKQIFVFVDYAYFGFGDGFAEDRLFVDFLDDNLEEFALGVSYSKNASLYRHRTGALFIRCKEKKKDIIESQMQAIVRGSVSNMPAYGSEIINYIFKNSYDSWETEVDGARKSIDIRKNELTAHLPKVFAHLKKCSGMFGLLGLSEEQILQLRKEHSIYLLNNSRINFAGIKSEDIETIADAVRKVAST
jgi:aspartate/tyrosine/aromatic aminotransferase